MVESGQEVIFVTTVTEGYRISVTSTVNPEEDDPVKVESWLTIVLVLAGVGLILGLAVVCLNLVRISMMKMKTGSSRETYNLNVNGVTPTTSSGDGFDGHVRQDVETGEISRAEISAISRIAERHRRQNPSRNDGLGLGGSHYPVPVRVAVTAHAGPLPVLKPSQDLPPTYQEALESPVDASNYSNPPPAYCEATPQQVINMDRNSGMFSGR